MKEGVAKGLNQELRQIDAQELRSSAPACVEVYYFAQSVQCSAKSLFQKVDLMVEEGRATERVVVVRRQVFRMRCPQVDCCKQIDPLSKVSVT
jgi:hypothetical protein